MYNEELTMIEFKIHEMCDKSLTDFGIPASNRNNSNSNMDPLEGDLRKPYDLNKSSEYISESEPKLVNNQHAAYNCVLNNVRFNEGNIYIFGCPRWNRQEFIYFDISKS